MTGNTGETEVTAKFERLGWGVAPNPKHDLGTDLWLMARDSRLFDLGLVVGAQVKTGPSWFREESSGPTGERLGWWFRDADRRHIDAWLAHGLPHLIVLHDLVTGASYWAHVAEEAVISTGKGAKILVPVGHQIDEAHRDALLRVAASKKTGGTWEGSAWSGADAVAPSAQLRHALIVPRLVAPHPNTGHASPVAPAQAVALLVQARLQDLREQAEQHPEVPSLADAASTSDWDWRLVGAMGARVTQGDSDGLVQAAVDAPDPGRRTAAAAAAAATLLEDGLAENALTVLDAALAPDDAGPLDHAWLTVQKARACLELGRVDEARDLAAAVQTLGATDAHDVTATALAGVAAQLLFNTSGWGAGDLGAMVAGSDTVAAWWRTQSVSRGLTALAKRTFWSWSGDTTVRYSAGDTANDQLFSASITASYLGDHGTWRHLAGLLAQDGLIRLTRHCEPTRAAEALDRLRVSGNSDDMKHAVRRLADDGPAAAVTLAAARVTLDAVTRTTAPSSLILLERGGDLLEADTADRTVAWLLDTIRNPALFAARTSPSYLLVPRLVDTLSGVVGAAGMDAQGAVAEAIAGLAPEPDQGLATAWARTAHALPSATWTDALARRIATAADGHHWSLRTPLLGIASPHDPAVRQRLLDEATAGRLDALVALGDVTRLPPDVVAVLVPAVAGYVRGQIEEATAGLFSMGTHDYGRALALLSVWHPALADWQPLLELISDPRVAGGHKRGAMTFLAGVAERVPDDIKPELAAAAGAAASQPRPAFPGLFGERADASGPAAELAAALATETAQPDPDQLPALLAGDIDARRSAVRIATRLRRDEETGLLLALAWDDDPSVRASAAQGMANLAADGLGGPVILAAVRRAAADPGRRVPGAIAAALSERESLPANVAGVLDLLRTHASAAVRRAAVPPLP